MSPAKPFPQGIQWSLKPAGPFLSFDQGPLQARIYKGSGHLELVGPDLAGNAGSSVIDFAPPAIQTAGGSSIFGRVISAKAIDGGLQIKQALGASNSSTDRKHRAIRKKYSIYVHAFVIQSALRVVRWVR